jgi:hypothetical protein
LRLELAPPLLGEVVLELRHEGHEVTASATMDRPATVETLRQVQAQVQQALTDQGVRVSSFEVSCRGGGQGREHSAPSPQPAPAQTAPQRATQPRTAARVARQDTLVDLYA